MFEEYNICPYTGLRSFTEEESIYFKGRDQHIQQATEQLERNKFLMLTGASGDGKSSLVFAGIVPNARAGFLKSKFTNWTLANFRPERSPFHNLCRALASALEIKNVGTVESELQHGFSALVDLYKSSKKYVDKNSTEWLEADESKRAAMNRQASNILILADQFEEFFTNPENYIRGVPSNDAALTLNLLLETAKIAMREDLPIYIVFTMRSDYIGQCAAFRGLPEMIGFSQFFVPRLNRRQLQEVIEDPAELAGINISRRLVERLIHDVTEGTDQLPILQHALNQIWKAAGDGKEELDLIHYAMVGGLPPDEIPDEHKDQFETWLRELSPEIRNCFTDQSLQNVLDTHANILYFSAAEYVKGKSKQRVSTEDCHEIIRTVFTSLTKIDHSRAVRNRMTLKEITDILSRKELGEDQVAAVIDIFRESGNTFIHPFISAEEGEERKNLDSDTVLDITHESLIRNWQMLRNWAEEEYDKFVVFADLKQQVDRWIENDRSWGFLLPIGSMVFFERWFVDKKINSFWINRYNEQVTETKKDLNESKQILNDTESFLKQSRRRHAASLAVMRLGARKIVISLVILAVVILSSFTIYDRVTRQNFYVLDQANEQALRILDQDIAPGYIKASYLIMSERVEKGSALSNLDKLSSNVRRVEAAVAVAENIYLYDPRNSIELGKGAILYADSIANILDQQFADNGLDPEGLVSIMLELQDVALFASHYDTDLKLQEVVNENARRLAKRLLAYLTGDYNIPSIKDVNEIIAIGLSGHSFSSDELKQILTQISPLEGTDNRFTREIFAGDRILDYGSAQDKVTHNGLYINLAALYAASGNVEKAKRSVDTLFFYHPNFENWATDGNTIGGYLASYEHWDELENFVQYLSAKNQIKPYQVYWRMLNRSGRLQLPAAEKMNYVDRSPNTNDHMVLEYLPDHIITQLYQATFKKINLLDNADERFFTGAMTYKHQGVLTAKRAEDRQEELPRDSIYTLFDKAFEDYSKVSEEYLQSEISTYFRIEEVTQRKNLFKYPDLREVFQPFEPRSRYHRFVSPIFAEYIMDNNLLTELYTNIQELQLVSAWTNEYKSARNAAFSWWGTGNKVNDEFLSRLYTELANHPLSTDVNWNVLRLLLADIYFKNDEIQKAREMVESMDFGSIRLMLQEEFAPNNAKAFQRLQDLHVHLVVNDMNDLANSLRQSIYDDRNQIRFFANTAFGLYGKGMKEKADSYLDSAMSVYQKDETLGGGFLKALALAIAMQGEKGSIERAQDILASLNPFLINLGYRVVVRSAGVNNNFYEGLQAIPDYASSEQEMMAFTELYYGQVYFDNQPEWKEFDHQYDLYFKFSGFNVP